MKIACLGDSITYYGSPGAVSPYCQVLQKTLNDQNPGVHHVANHGVRSDKVTVGFQTRWPANIQGRGYDALCFLGGINDVAADVTAAAIESAAQTILDAARTAGMRVVIIGMSPFANDSADFTTARETVRTTVNSWYASYASTNSLPFVNTDTLLGNGASPPALAVQYAYGDGLHWLDAACSLIAAQVKTALGI